MSPPGVTVSHEAVQSSSKCANSEGALPCPSPAGHGNAPNQGIDEEVDSPGIGAQTTTSKDAAEQASKALKSSSTAARALAPKSLAAATTPAAKAAADGASSSGQPSQHAAPLPSGENQATWTVLDSARAAQITNL